MIPIDDGRPFSEVLRDWMDKHSLTYDTAAALFGAGRSTLADWLAARQTPRHEQPCRALMTLHDEGRIIIPPANATGTRAR